MSPDESPAGIVEPEPLIPDYPVLWQLRISHFNEKARWALDYKNVPHRRRSLVPGRHSLRSRRLGGKGTTPLLVADGSVFGDSTEIVAELERRYPDPPLYPDTEVDRKAALELEDHFDRELGPQIRSALFAALIDDRRITVDLFWQGQPRRERAIVTALWPLLKVAIRRTMPADPESERKGREATISALELIESELNGDYLVGDRFSVADLTAAALLFPLVAPPQFAYWLPDAWPDEWEQFRRSLSGRRAYQWVLAMFARYRGTSAAVSDD
ncbi:MAG: glutathione S-transferase family protein [Solirubrobacterales bacterium]